MTSNRYAKFTNPSKFEGSRVHEDAIKEGDQLRALVAGRRILETWDVASPQK